MLDAIKQFFERNILAGAREEGAAYEHALQLATAALLFEMMRMDDEIGEEERRVVMDAVQLQFSLSSEETIKLMCLAEEEAEQSTDYHQFTSLINKRFTPKQKLQLIEHLWRVAYADDRLDKYEEHLVRKLAELIHVPHRAFIAAKHRVLMAK